MRRISLRSRIALWFVALTAALIFARSVAIYIFTRNGLTQVLDDSLDEWCNTLASTTDVEGMTITAAVTPGIHERMRSSPARRAYGIFALPDLRQVNASGPPTGPALTEPPDRIQHRLMEVADPSDGVDWTAPDPGGGRDFRLHAAIFTVRRASNPTVSSSATTNITGEPPRVMVVVAEDFSVVDTALGELIEGIALTLPFFLFAAVLCGWFVARRIVNPLTEIANAAANIRLDDPNHKVPRPGTRDELDSLSDTLNDTFRRLRANFENERRFTADASHELRTPIAIIKSQAEVALRRPRECSDYRETLEQILVAGRRIEGVIDALLTLARAESAAASETAALIDLRSVLSEAVATHVAAANAKELKFVVEAPDPAVVSGKRDQLGIVFGNLVSNAIRYSDRPSTVRIRVKHASERVVAEIQDEGIGIPAEKLPRIFDRFFRVDEDRSRMQGGAGLGLSLVKSIVEGHGGSVSATSELGAGTTVRVEFPAAV